MKNKLLVNVCLGFVKITGILPALLFFKPKVYKTGKNSKRLKKGYILVSNHTSLLDFPLYLILFWYRSINFLMAEVLFRNKLLAVFLKSIGGIMVDRDTKELGFVSRCIDILDNKGTVGIFPQGRLPIGNKPFPFTSTTAYIALKSGAPILPVYTEGKYGITKRSRVVIGDPIILSEHCKDGLSESEQLKYLTEFLQEKIFSFKEIIGQDK